LMSTPATLNDDRLIDLSSQPAEDLWPAMKSAAAVAPWIVLLAFLPPLAGLPGGRIDERTAAWGNKAVDRYVHFLEQSPPSQPAESPTPPLHTWLTMLMMLAFGVDSPVALVGVSYLAAAGTVLAMARLGRRLGRPRVGLLAAFCCAGTPLLLNGAHTGTPETLGACLQVVCLERFFAHLEGTVAPWSGRLLVAGLAWGGSWLALGWPALTLGIALTLHPLLYRESQGGGSGLGKLGGSTLTLFRRSVMIWWMIAGVVGGWWYVQAIGKTGIIATFAWLLDPTPNAISPLFPSARGIALWGETAGHVFLWGWTAIGLAWIVSQRSKPRTAEGNGRMIALLSWWLMLVLCRLAAAMAGADPTVWDVLQVAPACLTAALGMESVLDRSARAGWFAMGIGVGLVSVAVHLRGVDMAELRWAVAAGGVLCLAPVLANLIQVRSVSWEEPQVRRALSGLLISTAVAHGAWGVGQSVAESPADARLADRLAAVKESGLQPGAIVIVSDAPPLRSLMFQFRRRWPEVPLVAADRWETAVPRTFADVRDWADAEFLVVELTRRESQFRRPGAGWLVTQIDEPRRYLGERLTLHRVRVQTP
jgi:hypothetical protein